MRRITHYASLLNKKQITLLSIAIAATGVACGFYVAGTDKGNKYILFAALFAVWFLLAETRSRVEKARDDVISAEKTAVANIDRWRRGLATTRGVFSIGNAMLAAGGVLFAVKIAGPITYALILTERFFDLRHLRSQLHEQNIAVPPYTRMAKLFIVGASVFALVMPVSIGFAVAKHGVLLKYVLPTNLLAIAVNVLFALRNRFDQLFALTHGQLTQTMQANPLIRNIKRLKLVTEYSASIRAVELPMTVLATLFGSLDKAVIQGIGGSLLVLNFAEAFVHVGRAKLEHTLQNSIFAQMQQQPESYRSVDKTHPATADGAVPAEQGQDELKTVEF